MVEMQRFEPDWISPPGDTIADALEELSMSQAGLAERTGFTRKHINGLIKGRVAVTADAALRLEAVLGEPASFWLQREAQYREALARRSARKEAMASKEWLRELPLKWMSDQGWMEKRSSKEEQVDECLRFFGVASVGAWRTACAAPLAAFRASPKVGKKLGSVAAWLRRAELQAAAIDRAPYDRQAFRRALPALRSLTRQTDPAEFVPRVQRACAECGVAVVLVPAPPGCPIHGATRWLAPDKALLALSVRYKTDDQLWFSFFHEAAHLLKHGKKLLFVEGVDGLDGALEEEANRFARDLLIPAAEARKLTGIRSKERIVTIARDMGVAPGILVGRMQREGWLPWTHMNGLKVRYAWVGPEG